MKHFSVWHFNRQKSDWIKSLLFRIHTAIAWMRCKKRKRNRVAIRLLKSVYQKSFVVQRTPIFFRSYRKNLSVLLSSRFSFHFIHSFGIHKRFSLYLFNKKCLDLRNAFGNQFNHKQNEAIHYKNPIYKWPALQYGYHKYVSVSRNLSRDALLPWRVFETVFFYDRTWKWHFIDKCVLKCWWKR